MHYNEFQAVKMARLLMEEEACEVSKEHRKNPLPPPWLIATF